VTALKVAVVHNHYQRAGGEDTVCAAEIALLVARAHDVVPFHLDNTAIEQMGRVALARACLWNRTVHGDLRRLFAETKPAIAHFHNTFPLVSPAAYYAARAEGVAVVQTLHNYRLLCPNGILFRQGGVCENCVGRSVPWPSVVHACYRGSRSASAVTAGMLTLHRALGTWTDAVDLYIALTNFSRRKFIEGGIPEEKIVVKPNFLSTDPGVGLHKGGFALFVGRLAVGKGIQTLLEACRQLGGACRLKIVGEGPLESHARESISGVEWLGWQSRERVTALMREASFLIFPSEWYETFGMALVEAFAAGLPVVASGLGSAAEIVRDYETGRHFAAGDAGDLAAKIEWALAHPAELAEMGRRARREYELNYTPDQNYRALIQIYTRAIHARASGTRS
jgi:glycosyltransferase involved in cell wall biosynthesis